MGAATFIGTVPCHRAVDRSAPGLQSSGGRVLVLFIQMAGKVRTQTIVQPGGTTIMSTEHDQKSATTQYIDLDAKPDAEGTLGAGVQGLNSNATSIFWMMKGANIPGGGPHELTFQAPSTAVIIRDDSQVAVSITELHPQGFPKLGAATLQVLNVVPRTGSNGNPGTVTVRFQSSFNFLVPGRFNFIIVN